jgi:hypothetical protein
METNPGGLNRIGSIRNGQGGQKSVELNNDFSAPFGNVSHEILSKQMRGPQQLSSDTPIYWAYGDVIVQFADFYYAESQIKEALSVAVRQIVIRQVALAS